MTPQGFKQLVAVMQVAFETKGLSYATVFSPEVRRLYHTTLVEFDDAIVLTALRQLLEEPQGDGSWWPPTHAAIHYRAVALASPVPPAALAWESVLRRYELRDSSALPPLHRLEDDVMNTLGGLTAFYQDVQFSGGRLTTWRRDFLTTYAELARLWHRSVADELVKPVGERNPALFPGIPTAALLPWNRSDAPKALPAAPEPQVRPYMTAEEMRASREAIAAQTNTLLEKMTLPGEDTQP